MHKAWHGIEKVPYCVFRLSIKFQGHSGRKIDDLNPIWVRLLGQSQLSNPSDLPCLFPYRKQDAVELSELTQNPDPSTSIQIMDSTDQLSMTVVAPGTSTTYQDQLNQSIPQGQQVQQEVIVVQNSRQSAACSGVVMKTEVR